MGHNHSEICDPFMRAFSQLLMNCQAQEYAGFFYAGSLSCCWVSIQLAEFHIYDEKHSEKDTRKKEAPWID